MQYSTKNVICSTIQERYSSVQNVIYSIVQKRYINTTKIIQDNAVQTQFSTVNEKNMTEQKSTVSYEFEKLFGKK